MNTETDKDQKIINSQNRRTHLANERTFLAWIRTSIGIMALGFIVEKFIIEQSHTAHEYASILGVFIVGFAALMGILAFIRCKKVEKQIDKDIYQSSLILDILLTISILVIGLLLVVYMLSNT